MPFAIKFSVPDNLAREMDRAGHNVLRLLQGVLTKSAIRVRDTAKKKIKAPPKTGRMYKRGKKQHQASAPGEAPATDRGHLASSITFNVQYDRLGADIGSDLPYADILELGSDKGMIAARPYLRPSLYDNEQKIFDDVNNVLRGVL